MSDAIRKVSYALPDIARELDWMIEAAAGERVAFSLFVWTKGRCSYISSAERGTIILVLEKMLARWKAGMPDIPAHEVQ